MRSFFAEVAKLDPIFSIPANIFVILTMFITVSIYAVIGGLVAMLIPTKYKSIYVSIGFVAGLIACSFLAFIAVTFPIN